MSAQQRIDWPSGIWRDLLAFNAMVLILALIYDAGCRTPVNDEDAVSEALAPLGIDMPSGGWFG